MEHDSLTNPTFIILGRPFMKIVRTKIDVNVDTLTMKFERDIEIFEMLNIVSSLTFDLSLCVVQTFNFIVQEDFKL